MNIYSAKFLQSINSFAKLFPEYVWALLFIGLVGYFTIYLLTLSIVNYEMAPRTKFLKFLNPNSEYGIGRPRLEF